jgi:ATP-binding cassette subfamily B protein/ATP-binding cassette subfamily C protein
MKRGAEGLGFNARSVKANDQIINQLHKVPLPAIIHWQGRHWVVLYGKLAKNYVVADPAFGHRRISRQELMSGWNGIMLLLEPDPERFAQELPDEKPQGFSRFLNRIQPYRTLLAEALIINIALGVLSLTSPFLIQILTDDVLVRGDTQLLTIVVIGVILMGLFNGCLQFVQSIMIAHFGQRLHLGLVLEFGRKILHLPLPYYESRRSGEIVSRLQDINEINQLVAQIVARLPSQFFVAFISLGFMLFYSWKLTGLSLLVASIMTLVTLPVMPILQRRNRSLLILGAENQGVLVETFKGALEVKATTAAGQFWEEFQTRFGRLANLSLSMVKLSLVITTLTQFIATIGGVVLLAFGSLLVINKELSIGQLLAFNAMQSNVLGLISAVVNLLDEYFRSQTAVSRLLEVIDAAPETKGESNKPVAEISGNANIRCSNLYFHHTGRVDLLEDFSITLPGGTVIALIGKSGCGKSTLAKLIAGLYQPQSGNIRIGIYNLADLPLDCLRQQLVYVPQDAHFWSRSILENFRC